MTFICVSFAIILASSNKLTKKKPTSNIGIQTSERPGNFYRRWHFDSGLIPARSPAVVFNSDIFSIKYPADTSIEHWSYIMPIILASIFADFTICCNNFSAIQRQLYNHVHQATLVRSPHQATTSSHFLIPYSSNHVTTWCVNAMIAWS
jgi:hypothetical protein